MDYRRPLIAPHSRLIDTVRMTIPKSWLEKIEGENPANAKSKATKSAAFKRIAAYCESKGYPIPRHEYHFHPVRKWRWDAAWPELKLAVEIHGAVYVQGRHNRGKGFEDDQEKFATAAVLGWRLAPITTGQFEKGWLWRLLDIEFGEKQS